MKRARHAAEAQSRQHAPWRSSPWPAALNGPPLPLGAPVGVGGRRGLGAGVEPKVS